MQHSKPSHVRSNCAACRREAPASVLQRVRSRLDFETRYLCPACIEHQAEALAVLISMVNTTGWKELPDEVRRTTRVWDTDGYVTIPDWAGRMDRRQRTMLQEAKDRPLRFGGGGAPPALAEETTGIARVPEPNKRPKQAPDLPQQVPTCETVLARSKKGSQAKAAGQTR